MDSLSRFLAITANSHGPAFVHQPDGEDLVVLPMSLYEELVDMHQQAGQLPLFSPEEEHVFDQSIEEDDLSFEALMTLPVEELVQPAQETVPEAPVYEPIPEPVTPPTPEMETFIQKPEDLPAEVEEPEIQEVSEFISFDTKQPSVDVPVVQEAPVHTPFIPVQEHIPPMSPQVAEQGGEYGLPQALDSYEDSEQVFLDEPV